MFLYSEYPIWKKGILKITLESRQSILCSLGLDRKEIFSPRKISILQSVRTFFSAPLKASFTVETALVLPVFLLVMIPVLQYGNMMGSAVRLGTAMAETGKNLAVSAYVSKYGGDPGKVKDLAVGALTASYAHYKVKEQSGDTPGIKNANMALSSFLKEDEMIDLVLTYQGSTGSFFIQRACVRAWTGRNGSEKKEGADEAGKDTDSLVYVTATGKVYHKDEECTYLKLSVREVSLESLDGLRNDGGGIYHACESCGGHAGEMVYITDHGNRYHSTLTCSGLKRTVNQMTLEEAEGMRACSKCGGS